MSLPRPAESRAFASSPAPGPPLQQTTAASHANVADFQSPPLATQSRPVTHGQTPLGENNAHDVEVYVLSEIWKVFEQVVRQVRPYKNQFLSLFQKSKTIVIHMFSTVFSAPNLDLPWLQTTVLVLHTDLQGRQAAT